MPHPLNQAQPAKSKIYYLDNIKVLLTVLVVLHHTVITYGGPGSWYYRQPSHSEGALIPMTLFVATNQAFFMGMFFMLFSYFIEPSYHRKGRAIFIVDRLKRLGIPLLFYSFILSPVLNFIVYCYGKHKTATFTQYLSGYDDWIDFGVLWFAAALLLFTLIYAAIPNKTITAQQSKPIPKGATILLFAIAVGLISFLVRLVFHVGWVLSPPGFQFGHFTQYIVLFAIGIIAWRNKWLQQIPYTMGKRFAWLAVFMVVVMFPAIFVMKTLLNSPLQNFNGGFNPESFVYSIWEQVTGISIIVALLGIGRQNWNTTKPFLSQLSRSAFAVYIFHPLVLISLSVALSTWQTGPVIKLLAVAPLAVMSAFVLGDILVKIPGVNKII